jgi:ADP-ribose pyrophosphatase YjhB (NUDIX family)
VLLENENGEVLFVKRKQDPQKGYWDLPGGFVDLNETLEASVVREMQEELKIELTDFHYIGSMSDRYEFKGIRYHTVCALFLGKIEKGTKISPSDDAEDCAFFPLDAIPFEDLAFEGIKQALKQYIEAIKK